MDKKASFFGEIFMQLVLISVLLVSIFPLIWVVMSSFKTNGEILEGPFVMPSYFNLDAYKYIILNYNFPKYAMNSLFISLTSVSIALPIFSMAAYVIAKYNFRFKNIIYALFTITLLVPAHARTQPIFSLIYKLDLYDTKMSLILVYISLGLALSIFILKAAFMSVPKSLDEAALIDGASHFRIFWNINLPLAKNGIVTAGILMFLANWNEYYFASLLTISEDNRTLPIMTNFFNSDFSFDYTKTFASLTLLIIPGIIIYAIAQEQIESSFASSGIKG